MQEWPLKSKLDPEIYGPPESTITTEMIEEEIGGLMSVDKVSKIEIDYHIN
jgi:lipoxygenase